MAVTQQLARIPAAQLAACRRSAEALDDLCSFTAALEENHLDLNWWPVTLKSAWRLAGADEGTFSLLRRGFDGDEEVNPAYRDNPCGIWDHPVTALEPPEVGAVAEALRSLTPEAIYAVVPSDPDQIEAKLGATAREVIGDLPQLAAEQHTILRDFYEEAARRQLAVVLWWD